MANYATLKAAIQQVIKTNGNNEITGALLQQSLLAIINSLGGYYQFAGIATPSTNPGTPDQNVFYIGGAGTYSNFSSLVIPTGYIGVLKYNGTWTLETVQAGDVNAVKFVAQTLTDNQKTQARTNIEAASNEQVSQLRQDVGQLICNVNKYNNHPDAYATHDVARNAVPTAIRANGVILVYYSDDYGRYIEQYIGEGAYSDYPANALFRRIVTGNEVDFFYERVTTVKELYITGIAESDLASYRAILYNGDSNWWGIQIARVSDNVTVASYLINGAMPSDGVYVLETKASSGISGYVYLSYNSSSSPSFQTTLLYSRVLFLGNSPLIIDYLSNIRTTAKFNEAKGYTDTNIQAVNKRIDDVFTEGEMTTQFPVESNRAKEVNGIYGWGLAICENKTISAISAIICARTTAITKVRVQLLKNTDSGEVLADKTIDVSIAANTEQKVTVTFDAPVSYSGVIYCIVRYNAVGDWYKWVDYTDYPYPNILPCGIYNSWDANPIVVNEGFYLAVEYTEIETVIKDSEVQRIIDKVKDEVDLTELEQEVADVKAASDLDLALSLPDKISAVVGDKLQLFYKGMVGAVNPYDLDILVTCSKGKQYPRYWEFTPADGDVGNYTFNIKVKSNNGQVLAEKSTTISVVAAPTAPAMQKNVVCFGDSNTVDGAWPAEAFRRLTGTGGSPDGKGLANISFYGLMTKKSAGYCGFGGWTWRSYTIKGDTAIRFSVSGVATDPGYGAVYSNNGKNFTIIEVNITAGVGTILCSVANNSDRPTASGTLTKVSGNGDSEISFSEYSVDSANPLWDTANNKFSFVPYANLYCNGTIDVVYTLLTWNGLVAWMENFGGMLASMTTFATTLHTEFPNAKLHILGMQVPPVLGSMAYADSYGMVQAILAMNEFYQEFANDHSDFVEFVNVSAQFDTDNNCRMDVKRIRNTRSFLSYDPDNKYYMGDTVDKTVYNAEKGAWIHTPWVCIVAEVTGEWDESKWQIAPERVYEDYCVNAVHPGYNGYCQIADAVYRDFVAAFCQS